MNVGEALEARRSIKYFDPDHAIDDALLRELLAPVLLTPTSFNLQHWRFVVVRNKAQQVRLAEAAYQQVQVSECSAVILVLAKLPAHEDSERVWTGAPEKVQQSMIRTIADLYTANPVLQRDEALRSGGLASMALMLNAVDLGLSTCPLIGFDDTKVREILGIPGDHVVVLMVCVGTALVPPRERVGRLGLEEVVRLERFDGTPLTR